MTKKIMWAALAVSAMAILGTALGSRLTGQSILPRVGGVYFVLLEEASRTGGATASMVATFNDLGQANTGGVV